VKLEEITDIQYGGLAEKFERSPLMLIWVSNFTIFDLTGTSHQLPISASSEQSKTDP